VKDLFQRVQVDGLGLLTVDDQTGKVRKPAGRVKWNNWQPRWSCSFDVHHGDDGRCSPAQRRHGGEIQRVAEVLLGCVRPFDWMLGKLLAGMGVAFTGSIVYVAGGLTFWPGWVWEDTSLTTSCRGSSSTWLRLSSCTAPCAALSARLQQRDGGPAAQHARDASSADPMFMMMPVIKEPQGALATGLSLFPLFTPF